MSTKQTSAFKGVGLGLLLGAAAGAAGWYGVCGAPSKRKVRRRLMHAADAMGNALENMYDMMR